jgi:hypothetical protein
MRVLGVGYGAGERQLEHANVLRAISASVEERFVSESVEVVETNVDDVTGEVLGNLVERLLEEGAKDVCIIPTTTKKNRSGHIIKAISKPEDSAHLAEVIMEETGSLGVRVIPARHRLTAVREQEEVELMFEGACYTASVKIARDVKGKLLNVSAEFEDCKRISLATGVPLKRILQRVEEEGWRRYGSV